MRLYRTLPGTCAFLLVVAVGLIVVMRACRSPRQAVQPLLGHVRPPAFPAVNHFASFID